MHRLTSLLLLSLLTLGACNAVKPIPAHIDINSCTSICEHRLIGPEDLTVDHQSGVAYISSLDHRALHFLRSGHKTNLPAPGNIFRYNFSKPSRIEPMKVNPNPKFTNFSQDKFYPHGMSLWQEPSKPDRLFVVAKQLNEADKIHDKPDRVLIFEIHGNELTLVHMTDPISPNVTNLPLLNDIVAVGEREFFVTNPPNLDGIFDVLTRFILSTRDSKVLYYDGERFREAVTGLGYANGINIDQTGQFLYVADSFTNELKIFARKNESHVLSLVSNALSFSSSPDNLEWKEPERKTLLIGAHPNVWKFKKHSDDAEIFSPSQILEIQPASPLSTENYHVFEILLDENVKKIAGSSVAGFYKNKLLVGTVFGEKVFLCEYPSDRDTAGSESE